MFARADLGVLKSFAHMERASEDILTRIYVTSVEGIRGERRPRRKRLFGAWF